MTGAGNWTYLLPGRVPTLIDAGTGDPRFVDALDAALDGAVLAQVLVTHGHSDHASGALALAAQTPDARFLKMAWAERDVKWPAPWQPIADGEVIAAGDTELVVVHTPGHAPDHLCFWHPDTRTLFGGDLAMRGTTVYIPPGLRGDLTAYLHSLERVIALEPARILPAHGPVIDDPVEMLRVYIRQREEREVQVIEALRSGVDDVEALVARVYARLNPALLPMARESLLAHLIKLERDGVAARSGDRAGDRAGERWHIIEP